MNPTLSSKKEPSKEKSAGTSNLLKVSVIIPTKNRPADLRKTLETLQNQTRLPDELILVDQSKDRSGEPTLGIRTRYIYRPGLSGASAARNVGIAAAIGDIWLFLDDDVELEPNFIEEMLKAYSPDTTGVSGVVTNYDPPAAAHLLWESIFMRGPFHDDRQPVYWRANRRAQFEPVQVRFFGGGLMSFRADRVGAIRFDENLLGASPGEDVDFCLSLPRGCVLMITPRACLVHKQSPEARDPVHWLALDAQVKNYLRERHWRQGIWNNLCFGWLNVGYAIAAFASSLLRLSFQPWQLWRSAAQKGIDLARTGKRYQP